MYTIEQTEIMCLNVSITDRKNVTKDDITRLVRNLVRESEKMIEQKRSFYLCCNGINFFPYPIQNDPYATLQGVIEHFIYQTLTSEGDAFIALLRNQVYPAKWSCTLLLRELYVAVVMKGCHLTDGNYQQLIQIINEKMKFYEESKNIYGYSGSPIEDATAKMLLSVYGYIQDGNKLTKEYLAQKVS